jgi:hypothetical protein
MKYLILIILHFLILNFGTSQIQYEIEYKNGWIYFDKFGASSERGIINGYSIQSEIILWGRKVITDRLYYRLGIGYNNFWMLGVSGSPREISNFISFQGGLEYSLISNKHSFFINISNNILLNSKPNRSIIYGEKSLYTNLDMGISIKVGKRSTFNFSTPLTLFPLYKKCNIDDLNPVTSPSYNLWVETIGLNIGVKWKISKL